MDCFRFEKKDQVGVLTIDRVKSLNALNRALLDELDSFLSREFPSENVRVLIVTGAGEKAFVAGADIKEMQALDANGMREFCELGQRVVNRLGKVEAVTIAAVNGYALGGGLELALGCDFIFASENARFGLPEVTLGLIPGFGGTQRLTRAVGVRCAKEMIFAAQPITATEAFEVGLVNRVVEQEALLSTCFEVANKMAKNSFPAIMQARRVIDAGIETALNDGLSLEKEGFVEISTTTDFAEGMAAFIDKRKASFS